jgi:two-component system OmpR family response regulator
MLPDLDGLEVTRRLRSEGVRVPVILSTARDTRQDKVAGLAIGGDDYLTGRFALAEVMARVRSLLRRTALEDNDDGFLQLADIEMDEMAHEVRRAGTTVQLTATEFNLLRYFLLNPRTVLSNTHILDHVWDYGFEGGGDVVETYVSYVRRKLEEYGPPVIHAIRLVGCALHEPSSNGLALAS